MSRPDRTEAVGTGEPAEAEIRLLTPGSSLGDRYEIRRVLGTGGYAAVYLAWDRELRGEVALKVLRADRMSQSTLRRLQREALVARDLVSPRLLRIFDIGQADGAVYLTLEYVDGGTLRERIAAGAMPIAEALRIAAQICEGLRALHGAGIVHRDIKPGNVLLTAPGEVKLGDFGLALHWDRQDTRLTVSETIVGTVDYISPEQALGGEASPKSDLYALGVVLFEMLTGKLPYESASRLGAMLKHVRQNAPDLRALRKDAPAWLAALVAGLLVRDPEQRYPSAESVLVELERRNVFRTPHWRRRARRGSLLGAAILAVAALVTAAWWASRPRFAQLAMPQEYTLAALDRGGKTLWKLDGVDIPGRFTVARLVPGGPRRVVGIVHPPNAFSAEEVRRLSILDADTGKILESIMMPGNTLFPGYSQSWVPQVQAVDLDGDGADEILVVFTHVPFWPSYVVLYEPRVARSRILFMGSGHHRYVGAADLDGDGHLEIVLAGPNNRMGYRIAVAALRPDPPVNAAGGVGYAVAARSPGLTYDAAPRNGLLWYALIRRGILDQSRPLAVDYARRRLEVRLVEGSGMLDFDGFAPGEPGPPDRQDSRFAAYEALGESQRFLSLRQGDAAVSRAAQASALADRSGDLLLGRWARVAHAGALVFAGHTGEAEAFYRRALDEETDLTEVALTAARAFHLRGDLPRAERWYREGLDFGGSMKEGRTRSEMLEGLALAAIEASEGERVLPDVARFKEAFPNELTHADSIGAFLDWRLGRAAAPGVEPGPSSPDLYRYWALERRAGRNQENAEELLRRVDEETSRSGATALLASLRAELLERLGRRPEALDTAAQAWRQVLEAAPSDIPSRAHLGLVGGRYARLLRADGREREARRVDKTLADWRAATAAASEVN